MDGCGKGECFVGGKVGGEDGLFLILGSCWFEEVFVFAFGVVTLRLSWGRAKPEEHPVGAGCQMY